MAPYRGLHSFDNIRPNIYNQRVDNNITKQFKQLHNNEYITDIITGAQGLERAYSDRKYCIHGSEMCIAGSHTAKDLYDDVTQIPVWGDLRKSTR